MNSEIKLKYLPQVKIKEKEKTKVALKKLKKEYFTNGSRLLGHTVYVSGYAKLLKLRHTTNK